MTTEETTIEVARSFTTAKKVQDEASGRWITNPDHHPTIYQGTDAKFYDHQGKKMAKKDVPEYILAQVEDMPISNFNVAAFGQPKTIDAAEAMLAAGVIRQKKPFQLGG